MGLGRHKSKSCTAYQAVADEPGLAKGLLQQPVRPEETMHERSMNFMDFDTVNGQSKVLLAVDTPTRMLLARVCPASTVGPGVFRFLEEQVLAWGSPARLVMDAEVLLTK
ncbi:hypothetical protein SARC_14468, partial [Sphaeroforma arctica JP610]